MKKEDDKKTYFGFKKVNLEEKVKLVNEVFTSVSKKYDIMNDFMSLGIHRLWKRELVKSLIDTNIPKLLDVGGGTADISLEFLKKGGKEAYVVDINQEMLEQGREKALNNGYIDSIKFIEADAQILPFKEGEFELYNIAFCIRNVVDISKALQEAYRVLKKGGKFFCLEFSKVENDKLEKVYDLWSFKVIPQIGKYIAKNEEAYQYLVESIRKFPSQEEFKSMIEEVGFKNVSYKNLSSGIASIHYGEK